MSNLFTHWRADFEEGKGPLFWAAILAVSLMLYALTFLIMGIC